jgi:transcriptional regulator with XRE-family HTH domain
MNRNSDEATLAELGERIARMRLNRNLTQADLAAEAGVSLRTLQRLEGGESTQLVNLIRTLRALALLDNLDALVPAPAASPLQQVRTGGKERRRASPRSETRRPQAPWTWGDEE